MKPALLLVDLQSDFLARPGLVPAPDELVAKVAGLLEGCRRARVPVLHAHTVVRADGSDRMPHWIKGGYTACVENTPGAAPPASLRPAAGEAVFTKRYFNAFGAPGLAEKLRDLGTDTLVIAGVYLHGCVRASVLDAYERGFTVWVASDAVGTTDPLHGKISMEYLDGRAAGFMESGAILEHLHSHG